MNASQKIQSISGRITCLLAILFCILCSLHAESPEASFDILNPDKQRSDSLPFFVRHMPEEAPLTPDQTVEFVPLSKSISAHLSEVGYLGAYRLVLVRYLSDARLVHGSVDATGMVLLCSSSSEPTKFTPLIVEWDEDSDSIDDFSVSAVKRLDDLSFVWVRRAYKGTAAWVDRGVLTAPESSKHPQFYSLFSDTNPLSALEKEGWKLWHRGNSFNEDTLTWYYHLYRDPSTAGANDYPHRLVKVRYTFRDGKLWPEKPEFEDD